MWYQAGWFDGSAYAESKDGLHWKRLHELDPSCSSDRVLPRVSGQMRDGDAVWLDLQTANEAERYKMLAFYRCFDGTIGIIRLNLNMPTMTRPRSRRKRSRCSMPRPTACIGPRKGETGPSGDNTTFFLQSVPQKSGSTVCAPSPHWTAVCVCVVTMRPMTSLQERIGKAEDVSFWSRTDIYDRRTRTWVTTHNCITWMRLGTKVSCLACTRSLWGRLTS